MSKARRDDVRLEDVRAIHSTPDALLCEIDGEKVWIPKSQISDDSEVYDDEENAEGALVISAWIAEKKGLG